jgi:hypothetical protein
MSRADPARADRRGRALRAATSVGTLVVAALLPKCPLCVAAALSALGLGTIAGLSPLVRPVAIVGALLAVCSVVVVEARRRRQRARRRGACPACG